MTVTRDQWDTLRSLTHARIALGRAGHAVPTSELLKFRLAHSQARDSVWHEVDVALLHQQFQTASLDVLDVQSQCSGKQQYLLNPSLGRLLDPRSQKTLQDWSYQKPEVDCALVVADGLSAHAVQANSGSFVTACVTDLKKAGLTVGPIVLARYARVALGDQIAPILKARSVLVLIGERPGLASAESLSVYFTYRPQKNSKDNDRNCISNIHAAGIAPQAAAAMAAYLVKQAIRRQLSGVELKVEYPGLQRT